MRLMTSLRRRWSDWRFPLGYRVTQRGGATWLLNHRHYVDRQMLFRGDYEADQRARLFKLAADLSCSVFLDIGANFGLYSVHAVLDGRFEAVHAFEPDPRSLAFLRTNFHLNGVLKRVLVHETALSVKDGTVSFIGGGDAFTGQSRVIAIRTDDSEEIRARRLDSILRPKGALCIKIDVEGHELAVLEGARGLLEGSSWVIQVECLNESSAGVSDFLGDLGGALEGRIGDDRYFVRR
jgi:FkbM family methyltransferase